MKTLQVWYGAHNSALYLIKHTSSDASNFLTIEYGYSLSENHFEAGRRFFINDLNQPDSELMQLIKNDFPQDCAKELFDLINAEIKK